MIQCKGYLLNLEHCFVVTSLKGSSTAMDISMSSLGHGMVVASGGAGAGDIQCMVGRYQSHVRGSNEDQTGKETLLSKAEDLQ